jgi:hypothetical protein
MDDVLRTKLWSAVHLIVLERQRHDLEYQNVDVNAMVGRLWLHFFHQPLDKTPGYEYGGFSAYVRAWFFKCKWYEVYDFLEALLGELSEGLRRSLVDLLNNFLETELSAYRIVDGRVAEITSGEEIASIEEAIAETSGLAGVNAHLRDALAKLTDRAAPDYRNSIKESISAVETICRLITRDDKATLGQAIKRLRDAGVSLHPSLEQAWSKLYGYTSDEGGIRHSLMDESAVSFADAKYMLVSCSAFVNLLIELTRGAGIALTTK